MCWSRTSRSFACLDIRNLFFRRTMGLDLSAFSDQGSAELMARFTNDMDSVAQGFNTVLSKLDPRAAPYPLRSSAGAFWFNWRLTCLALVLVPVSAYCTARAGKLLKKAMRRSLESMSSIYKILQESFQGIKVVKAFTNERYERRRFFLETKALYKKSLRVAKIDALSDPVLEILALTDGRDRPAGRVVPGAPQDDVTSNVAVQAATRRPPDGDRGSADPLHDARRHGRPDPQAGERPLQGPAGLGRLRPDLPPDGPNARASATSPGRSRACPATQCRHRVRRGRLQLRPAASPCSEGSTLNVHHGETVALVGPNGCGKSTLMNLLPRFWDVQSGSIRVDGHDLRDVQVREPPRPDRRT